MRRTKRGGWPYSQPPNTQFEINRDSPQADGLVLWMPWGGGTPGSHHHIDRIKGLVFTEGGTPVWVLDGEQGWALEFDDGANETLLAVPSPVLAPPLTLTTWVNTNDATVNQCLVGVGDSAAADYHGLFADGATGPDVKISARSWISAAWTTTSFVANSWNHGAAVFSSNINRACYLNGGSKGTAANDQPATLNRCSIGVTPDSTPSTYLSGLVRDVRIYNRALTDTEVYQLYAEPWELYKPLIRRWLGWKSPVPPPVGGHMTLWGRYWGP